MTTAEELLLAILRQAMRDYIRLDPDSDDVSAEYHIDQGHDFRTAENFLYNNVPIEFGEMSLTLADVCVMLRIDERKIKQKIARVIVEY